MRISMFLWDPLMRQIFTNNIRTYSDTLKRCGFQEKPAFIPETPFSPNANERRKNRCKIIWFNPPYSINVKTNIDKVLYYLNILDKDSPLITSPPPPFTHLFHKSFNKNTVKIIYSCMHNMKSIISAHNRSILNPPKSNCGCNRSDNLNCPLQNQCLTLNIVYQANVSDNLDNEKMVSSGESETPFKERYGNHVRDSKYERYSNATELSK